MVLGALKSRTIELQIKLSARLRGRTYREMRDVVLILYLLAQIFLTLPLVIVNVFSSWNREDIFHLKFCLLFSERKGKSECTLHSNAVSQELWSQNSMSVWQVRWWGGSRAGRMSWAPSVRRQLFGGEPEPYPTQEREISQFHSL